MNANAITRLFKEACNFDPPLKGKPSNHGLLAIWETILPLLMVIPYNLLKGVHSLVAILTDAIKYKANHGNAEFLRPVCFPLQDKNIANNATTITHLHAEGAHKSHLNNYASYEAATCSVAKFLHDVANEIWYNDCKDAKTFYTKVTAIKIVALLDANSRGLNSVDMLTLHTNMMQYYVQADSIPRYIPMMEDAQKKATWAGMPVVDVELVMLALAAVLMAQNFPCKVYYWEVLPAAAHGEPGRWPSALPTSSASTNFRQWGGKSEIPRRCTRSSTCSSCYH